MKSPAQIAFDAIDASSLPECEKGLAKLRAYLDMPLEAWLPIDYHAKRAAYLAGNDSAVSPGRGR